jgi:hypothetical protein
MVRGMLLPLPLIMFGNRADDAYDALAANHFTLFAALLD